ncbi:MAG: toprim domain-containing protein [Patescibacteria group bacterium]|nr:toprim domain-containing protein [Patescibacteria group bacterium]
MFPTLQKELSLPDGDIQFKSLTEKEEYELPPLDKEDILRYHNDLWNHKDILDWLHKKRGYTDDTIKKFLIGWDGKNIVTPIFDGKDNLVNLKFRRDPTLPSTKKAVWGISGRNGARLFNEKVIIDPDWQEHSLVIGEGEPDIILLDQIGIRAISSTAGAGSYKNFKEEWRDALKGVEEIFICLDNDTEGETAADSLADYLTKYLSDSKIYKVHIPVIYPGCKDVTDFIVSGNKKKSDFIKLLTKAQREEPWTPLPKDPQVEIKARWTETPHHTYSIDQVVTKVEEFLPNTSTALKLTLAVATSGTRENNVMLWMFLVGSPSSGKTDLVRLMKPHPCTYHVDGLTLNAFISGERQTKKEKVYDLLPKLDKTCFIVKDWTVIFSLDERMTKKIIGDMVGIYDKTLSKHSSRRGTISYNSQFSHLGCITPATLNKNHNYLNMIGNRFLSYTIPDTTVNDDEKSFEAIFEKSDRAKKEIETAMVVSDYLDSLNNMDLKSIKPLGENAKDFLKVASRFVARGRGVVILQQSSFKNENEQEVSYYEALDVQIEKPWRAVQQLLELAQYLALVNGHNEVGLEELEIVKEVVLNSMPADRAQAIKVLKSSLGGQITGQELSEQFGKSNRTARRLLDELSFLGIVKKDKGTSQAANVYTLEKEFLDFICMDIREFLSNEENFQNSMVSTLIEAEGSTSNHEESDEDPEKEVNEILGI